MAKKITLNADVFTVPLNKLVLSPRNVRKTYAAAEIEELAASIAAPGRGLIQNLGVSEQTDAQGTPTGMWEVVAGGRRFRALTLLVARKRLAAGAAIPCRRIADENALDASLAENEDRKALHPADAYEAFAELHQDGRGLGIEEIAARFGVTAHTIRQRLRLGTVSPVIMAAYREGKLTLDHVMAFTVTEDRDVQERAFADLPEWQLTPHAIRRVLTQANVPAHDPRVRLVGLDAYQAAGGRVQRDLFTEDDGGWLTDAALLERLVGERIQTAADQVQAEGWTWVVTDPAAARTIWYATRRVWPGTVALSEANQARRAELAQRLDELAADHPYGVEDAAEEVRAEVQAVQAELDALDDRERAFRPEDVARGGATVMLAGDGTLRIERGFIRPEDEPKPEPEPEPEDTAEACAQGQDSPGDADAGIVNQEQDDTGHTVEAVTPEQVPEDKAPALPFELDAELTAHRTAALRAEIMRQPDLALRVLAHSLATTAFYGAYHVTVARLGNPYTASYSAGAVGVDSPARQAIMAAEDEQRSKLPDDHAALWAWLQGQDVLTLHALIAVCVGRVADAGSGDWTDARHGPARVAAAAGLDMRQWWTAAQDSYLGRVTKAGILAAVREGVGAGAARRIQDMKKDAMAANAEALLSGKGWLPARLRVPGLEEVTAEQAAADDCAGSMEHPAAAE